MLASPKLSEVDSKSQFILIIYISAGELRCRPDTQTYWYNARMPLTPEFKKRYSHKSATLLPALLIIPFFFLLPQRHTLPSFHPSNRHALLTRAMAPSQTLDQTTILIIHTDCPLAATNFDRGIVSREMKFWEEDFCRCFFCSSCLALERECENCITQVKAR